MTEYSVFDLSRVQGVIDAGDASMVSCRQALADGVEAIHGQFEVGVGMPSVLAWHAELLDLILRRLWTEAGAAFDALTLLAVGGYGRCELYPASDIDICILCPAEADPARDEQLASWIAGLWDLRRDIGHSVRTIADCEREARADVTVVTNLMEARWLAGSRTLLDRMRAVIAPSNMWPSAQFFAAKMAEQSERRLKFQTNAYRLEPNVKESEGGLRDIQMISWVCQREFGTHSLDDLVIRELLNWQEYGILCNGLELVGRIRYLLHRLARRREDRLLFDYQREVARGFGYRCAERNQDIERLMQRYYRSVTELQRLNEILLQGIGGIISGVTARSVVIPISKRFQLRNGFLEVTHDEVFINYPPALLEIFQVFGDTPEAHNVRANTVRLIRSHLPLINARFCRDPVVRALFLQIFANPNKLTRKIRMMNRYGVLAAYLPAFDAVVGRMQYDLFHVYTVDEHTFRVIRNLRRLMLPELADEVPQCRGIAASISRPEVLYVAALFHDIAKGRDGDHSELGARDAERFCEQHGLDRSTSEMIAWLVRHHLLMSMTAQRRDISDPVIQHEFAAAVGTLERLHHLYLFTVADIRGTNPDLWNSFRASLLHALYRSTASLLRRGLHNPVDRAALVADRQSRSRERLGISHPDIDNERISALFDGLGDEYFQRYEPEEIARHCALILAHENNAGALVSMHHSMARGSMELLVYTPDDNALFALITTVLGQLQLNIQSATVHTTATGYALDTFQVLESDGSLIGDPARIAEIERVLQHELDVPHDIPTLGARRASRQLRHFTVPPEIEFTTVNDSRFAEVRITAVDRPGILSSIARTFLAAGVSVHAAKIATLGERIEDVFFVRDAEGRPLESELVRSELARKLSERL